MYSTVLQSRSKIIICILILTLIPISFVIDIRCFFYYEHNFCFVFILVGTCICPELLYTNFLEVKPYVEVDKKNRSLVSGLFPDLMNLVIKAVCVECRAYESRLYYDRTFTGHPSEKVTMKYLKDNVGVGSHMNFPIFGKFEFEKFQGSFPYIGIAYSQGSAMIVVDPEMKTMGMMSILKSIANAWSVIFVGVLLAFLCGWVFWFTVCCIFFLQNLE